MERLDSVFQKSTGSLFSGNQPWTIMPAFKRTISKVDKKETFRRSFYNEYQSQV